MISCIVLAAGLSERFGSPKALAIFDTEPVIDRIQQTLLNANMDEIIIVLGAHADVLKPRILKHKNVSFVYNKDYILGQTSSVKAGLQKVSPEAEGFLLYPVDYPCITSAILIGLVRIFLEKKPSILVPAYENHKGHPPIFHKRLKKEILALDHSLGLNTIVRAHAKDEIIYPVEDPGVIKTFNTPEELAQLQKKVWKLFVYDRRSGKVRANIAVADKALGRKFFPLACGIRFNIRNHIRS